MTTTRQYEFKDGHFVDTWNNGYDDTCDPAEHGEESWPEMLIEGTCGCGSPGVIVEAMAEYLIRVEAGLGIGTPPQIRERTPDFLADYLLASMASDMGLTEHGSSIYNVWLEPAGERWLELWRADAT